MSSKQKLQEKYVLYQLLNQNLEALKQQMEAIEEQSQEVSSTLSSIGDIHKIAKNNEVFIPIGSGCYGKGELTDSKSVVVNVGAGILVEKKIEDAKKFLDNRSEDIGKAKKEIQEHAEKVTNQMTDVGSEIQKLAESEGKS